MNKKSFLVKTCYVQDQIKIGDNVIVCPTKILSKHQVRLAIHAPGKKITKISSPSRDEFQENSNYEKTKDV